MPHIFGKLWHLAIIWAIRKAFQCILQGVRILLAKYTRISPTSENDSYLKLLIYYNELSLIKMMILVKWSAWILDIVLSNLSTHRIPDFDLESTIWHTSRSKVRFSRLMQKKLKVNFPCSTINFHTEHFKHFLIEPWDRDCTLIRNILIRNLIFHSEICWIWQKNCFVF